MDQVLGELKDTNESDMHKPDKQQEEPLSNPPKILQACVALKIKVRDDSDLDPALIQARLVREAKRIKKVTTLRGRKVFANRYGRKLLERRFKIEDGVLDPKSLPGRDGGKAFVNGEGLKLLTGDFAPGDRN